MIDSIKRSRPTDSALSGESTRPYILGVAGGSGSGKTFFARDLLMALGSDVCEIIYQDNYYIDQSKKFDYDGGSVNFDHPSALDFDLLGAQLAELKEGKVVNIPIYDFATHSRIDNTISVRPRPVVIVDGILIFHAEQVRKHFDDLVFFDTPETLRFERRLKRDVEERGRTPEGVRNQFLKQVKPMHDEFVEPSKKFANTTVKELCDYQKVFDEYLAKLKKVVKNVTV